MASPMLRTQTPRVTSGARKPWAPGSNVNQLAKQKAHLQSGIETRREQGLSSPKDAAKLKQINQGLTGIVNQGRADIRSQLGGQQQRRNPQQRSNLGAAGGNQGNKTPWAPGTDADTLNAQRAHIADAIAKRKARGIASPNDERRLAEIDKSIAGLNTTTPTTETGVTTETTPTTEAPPSVEDANPNPDAADALFPSMRSFEPANYEGSPLYKFQQQQGEKAINRTLAKRGLLNSGAEIEALSDFNTALGAGEADKARGYAQTEADRYERIQNNEAGRRERQGQRASDDLFRWTDLMLGQNPANANFRGTDNYAGAVGNTYDSLAKYLSDQYKRVSSGGGRSGGYNAPYFPGGPDFSNINTLENVTGSQTGNNFFNTLIKNLPSIFG